MNWVKKWPEELEDMNKGKKGYPYEFITADPFKKDLLDCEVFVDGVFDVKDLFNFLQKYGILSAIKIRENASDNADGSMRRAREVEEYKKEGYKEWARKKRYGRRWTRTEVIFSAVKGIFGENTRSKKRVSV